MRRGLVFLCDSLSHYAKAHGGRYIVFGSAASGAANHRDGAARPVVRN